MRSTTLMLLLATVALLTITAPPVRAEDPAGFNAEWVRCAQDDQGNIHMVTGFAWGGCYYSKYSSGTWSSPVFLPNSSPCWFEFTNPDIDVGPDGIPQVVYGTTTGDPHPNDLNPVIYAKATNQNGTSWNLTYVGDSAYRRNHARIAVDENNVAHITYMKTNKYAPYWWEIIYRRPDGTEKVVQHTEPDSHRCNNPDIACKDGIVHITWFEGGSGTMTTNVWHAAGAPYSDFPVFEQLTNMPYMWFVGDPGIAIAPDGHVDIVYIVADWNHPAAYKGVYSTYTGLVDGGWANINEAHEDRGPSVAFMNDGTRYVTWAHYTNNETMYVRNNGSKVTLTPYGSIDVCGGASGAWYTRTLGASGPVYYHHLEGGSPQFYPPTALIDNITPNPVTRGVDTMVYFNGTGFDNDEGGASIIAWEWTSLFAGILGTTEDISVAPINLAPARHAIRFRVRDDENEWSLYAAAYLDVLPDPVPPPPVEDLQTSHPLPFPGTVIAHWSPVADNLAMDSYYLYRGTDAWFDPVDPLVEIVDGAPCNYVDATAFAADSVAIYAVITRDIDGNQTPPAIRAGAFRFTLEDGE